MEKLKIDSKICPVGTFTFCAIAGTGILNEDKEKNNPDNAYEYKATLELDLDKAGELLDEIDNFIETHASKGKELEKVPYQTKEDYEKIPDGKVWLYAKTTTKRESKEKLVDREISLYDTNGNKSKLPEGMGVGNGSTGKILGAMTVWDQKKTYGATIWLSGIQLGNFVPYEFEEVPNTMEGDFKGFDTPQLEKDEAETTEEPKTESRRSRRSRRG